jgi:hypothetical protein
VTLLDELISRYGRRAVVTVRPYMPDSSGDIFRWVLEIDGNDPLDVDVLVRAQSEHVKVMLLVRGEDEIELARWHEDCQRRFSIKKGAPYARSGPADVVDTLGALRRRQEPLPVCPPSRHRGWRGFEVARPVAPLRLAP